MPKPKRPQPLAVLIASPWRELVTTHLTPAERRKVLIEAAEARSGALYDRLTDGLSEKNKSALTIGPMFVGGDTSDMDYFITEFWRKPVTDENIRDVVSLFKAWYKLSAPDEYHDPVKPDSLREVWEVPFLTTEY